MGPQELEYGKLTNASRVNEVPLRPWEIVGQMKQAKEVVELLQIFVDHQDRLDAIHLSALWINYGKLLNWRQYYYRDEKYRPAYMPLVDHTIQAVTEGQLG